MAPRGSLEKKALSMGVSEVLDLATPPPSGTVRDQLLEEPQLTLNSLPSAPCVHKGVHG